MEHSHDTQHAEHMHAGQGTPMQSDHHALMIQDFKQRFLIASIVSLPLIIFSPLVHFTGDQFVWLALSTIVFVYGGKPFFTHGWQEIRTKRPGMMTLVALAISVSYGYSVAVVFGLPGMTFFWELCTLIDVMLLGHWLEMRSLAGASQALEKLAHLLPAVAHVIDKEAAMRDIAVNDVQEGMTLVVLPGEKVPADGTVVKGQSEVNQALITGESLPILKTVGDNMLAGSVNGNGPLTIRVERSKGSTYIAQIIELVRKVLASKSQMQDLADKAALLLTIIAILAGFSTLLVWLQLNTLSFALERMVTVMAITCPHALGLAIPLVTMQLTTLAARSGLLIRNRTAFERARSIHTLIFDKTGTLTEGKLEINAVISLDSESEDEIVITAASIESYAQHAIAKALANEARKRNLSLHEVAQGATVPGKGATGFINGQEIFLGNDLYMKDKGLDVQRNDIQKKVHELTSAGNVVIYMADTKGLRALIAAADHVREEALDVCNRLKKMNITVGMITGDNQETADTVAHQLGIDFVLARVLPHQKAAEITALRKSGRVIAMVGDGINDAPALAAADIGIAIGAGTDVAMETADIILIRSNLLNVIDCIMLSRLAWKKMIENLLWATGYNVLAIPLAAGVLYGYGISLSPAVGAFLMSASTLIVVLNARFISYTKIAN